MSTLANVLIETDVRASVSDSEGVELNWRSGSAVGYNGVDVNFEVNIGLGESFHY